MRFSHKLSQMLCEAGWHPGRCAAEYLQQFKNILGEVMHPAACAVLAEFADLAIGKRVFFDLYYVKLALNEREKLPLSLRDSLCPIALTSYWSDATVWIDHHGRIFLLEPGELSYFSGSMDEAMEALVLGGEPEPVPNELQPGHWAIGQ